MGNTGFRTAGLVNSVIGKKKKTPAKSPTGGVGKTPDSPLKRDVNLPMGPVSVSDDVRDTKRKESRSILGGGFGSNSKKTKASGRKSILGS